LGATVMDVWHVEPDRHHSGLDLRCSECGALEGFAYGLRLTQERGQMVWQVECPIAAPKTWRCLGCGYEAGRATVAWARLSMALALDN
jgi:hypothetical protein